MITDELSVTMTFTMISHVAAKLVIDDREYLGTPAQVFKDFLTDLQRTGALEPEVGGALRRRYTIIDHEDANTMEVGTAYVLSPAKNPADLAALHTLVENVEPKLSQELQSFIDLIEAHPNRRLGTYGEQCLEHLTHPKLQAFKAERLERRGG